MGADHYKLCNMRPVKGQGSRGKGFRARGAGGMPSSSHDPCPLTRAPFLLSLSTNCFNIVDYLGGPGAGVVMESERTGMATDGPAEAREWVRKGHALRGQLRFEEAVKCYDCALELQPKNHRVWFARGRALSEATRNQEALACYEKALAIDPRYLMAWAGKARTLRRLGNREDAAVCLENYRRLAGK